MLVDREDRAIFTEQLRNRRGRPRSAQTLVVSVRIPVAVYDAYCRQSNATGEPVRAAMKAALCVRAPFSVVQKSPRR